MVEKLSINHWSEEDRPREKLERLGAAALSDAELMAILIGSGSEKESAVELSRRILNDCGNNLNTLGKLSVHDLKRYHGMGPAKAITILAACELGKRRKATDAEQRPTMSSAAAIYQYMLEKVQDSDVEEGYILLMNQALKLIRAVHISHGGFTEVAIDVRVVIKQALLNNATAIALCHNHPSGNSRPSMQDDRLTRQLQQACDTMRIHFVDHVIVTDGAFYSYRDDGRL